MKATDALLVQVTLVARTAGDRTATVRHLIQHLAAAAAPVLADDADVLREALASARVDGVSGQTPEVPVTYVGIDEQLQKSLTYAAALALANGRTQTCPADALTAVLATQQLDADLIAWLDRAGLRGMQLRQALSCPAELADVLLTLTIHHTESLDAVRDVARTLAGDADVWAFQLDVRGDVCTARVAAPPGWDLPPLD